MGYKMKGFTFPGITTKGNENRKDGRSKSSAFQKDDVDAKNKQKVFNKKVDDLKDEYSKITDKNSNRAEQLKKEAKKIGLTLEQKPSYSADTGDM